MCKPPEFQPKRFLLFGGGEGGKRTLEVNACFGVESG